jgi:peptidyl-prolyl cis-trans isomerase SurA
MQFVRKSLKFSGKSKVGAKGLVALFFLVFSQVVFAQENQGFTVDKIVAKVDNYIVLKSDLDRAYLDYVANGGTAGDYARCQFLAILVRNKLMMAKAEIDSVVVTDSEVDENTERRMGMILSQYGGSADELEKKFEKSFEQIKVELRDQIREQMVVNEMERTITKGLTVTPAEVKRFYGKIPKDSLPFFSAEVEIAQIVKVAKISERQKEITRNELIALRDQILAGADFGTLAKKYSADPSVTSNNGDMGWVGRGRMVPQFEATAFKLKVGEISMPFETDYGLHILQLLGRRGNEYHSRHILIAPKPSEDDLKVASHYLDSIGIVFLEGKEMTFQKAAKEFSDDMMTKGSGGFFTDQDGGTRISVDEIDPAIFFAIDSMKVGSISRPLPYRSDEGRDAVRILLYKSRMAPHLASLTDDWSRIQAATLGQKKNKVLEKWFDKARKDVFISIDSSYDFCGILDE